MAMARRFPSRRAQLLLGLQAAMSISITGTLSSVLEDVSMQANGIVGTPPPPPPVAHGFPGFSVNAILQYGNSVAEGQLVESVSIAWWEFIEAFQRDPKAIYRLEPRQWEEILAGAFEREGFDEVVLTPRSSDFGRDVIATKSGIGSIRLLGQMKAYAPHRPVTASEVRDLFGTLSLDKSATKAMLTTTSTFAPRLLDDPGIREAVPFRIELLGRDELLRWLSDLARRPYSER